MGDPVRAAGGVLYRPAGEGVEVCLVHRPAFDDWALPKGKLKHGEDSLLAAVREVAEETGVRGRPQLQLPQTAYELPDGTPKTVDFWLMRAAEESGPIVDTDEVDEVAWLSPVKAVDRLTYPDDRALVEHVAGLPTVTAVVGLVRHAHAGERKKWSGNDALRPIDPVGQAQAERVAELFAPFAPQRLIAATPLRCKQTLEPLAQVLGGPPIVLDSAFAEPAETEEAPAKALVALQRLLELRDGPPPVVCSQGKIIPALLAALRDETDAEPYKTPKGDGWVITWAGDRLLGLSRL
jgi:8-oxo-dGTP pyrophosphatase MutT (NUDIX family)